VEIVTATPGWRGFGSCCRSRTRSWGIDLADDKQAAVVTDHDSRVMARRRVSARAWELGGLLDWAAGRAAAAGFASVTVACEPTGHRRRVLD
jgi:transposase